MSSAYSFSSCPVPSRYKVQTQYGDAAGLWPLLASASLPAVFYLFSAPALGANVLLKSFWQDTFSHTLKPLFILPLPLWGVSFLHLPICTISLLGLSWVNHCMEPSLDAQAQSDVLPTAPTSCLHQSPYRTVTFSCLSVLGVWEWLEDRPVCYLCLLQSWHTVVVQQIANKRKTPFSFIKRNLHLLIIS